MATGEQRFTKQQIERARAGGFEAQQAEVTAISGSSPPVVTVKYLGGSSQFPHLLSYTPVIGHMVAVVPYCGSQLILGVPGGFP